MMRPRLLIFSLAYEPFWGGAEVAVREITSRLPDFEFEMLTVNLDGRQAASEQVGNILVRRLGQGRTSKYFFPWTAYQTAVRSHRQKPYQFVWAIMANQAGMAAAWFKRLFPSVPFLLTLQEGDDLENWFYRLRLLGPRFYGVFRRADQITVISSYLARWAQTMGARTKVAVIPNGVEPRQFKVPGEKYKINREKIIISTSRLVKKNGLADLIRAMVYLPDEIKLQLVGAGPEEVRLKNLVRKLSLTDRVIFVGAIKPVTVADYLAQADAFCRPSRSEGLGNSFLEAMAAGLPVVGTPVGGIPDFLQDGVTGWFCKVNNPSSIAQKIIYLLDPANAAVVSQITQAARQLVEQKYTWPKIAAQMMEIFQSLI